MGQNRPTKYQEAIQIITSIIQNYDKDKMIPVYGFGAEIDGKTNHCFALNGV